MFDFFRALKTGEWLRARTWAELRSVGNSRVVQLSVVFPFIGYLILFNDEIARFLSMTALDPSPSSGSWIDVLWTGKLYFLYFGLMATGIASTIYQVTCPYIIKKHGDWADYVRVDGDSISDAGAAILGVILGKNYEADCSLTSPNNVTIDYMREWYSRQSRDKLKARGFVTALFGAGFFLLDRAVDNIRGQSCRVDRASPILV